MHTDKINFTYEHLLTIIIAGLPLLLIGTLSCKRPVIGNTIEVNNLRDTTTIVTHRNLTTWDEIIVPVTTYERIYKISDDTIYQIRVDYLCDNIDIEALDKNNDKDFEIYLYLPDSVQSASRGYHFATLELLYHDYSTYHISEYLREKDQGLHGDGDDYYITIKNDSVPIWGNDLFYNPSNTILRSLVADAIIEYRLKDKWENMNLKIQQDLEWILKWKEWFMSSDVSIFQPVAIIKDGIMFSFSYGTPYMDISFGEFYVHALVPYSKLKGMLKPPFDILVQNDI